MAQEDVKNVDLTPAVEEKVTPVATQTPRVTKRPTTVNTNKNKSGGMGNPFAGTSWGN